MDKYYVKELKNKYFSKFHNDDYEEFLNENSSFDEISALSELRKNIIKWYPFKENSKILQIGAGFGEVTGVLLENSKDVTVIEDDKDSVEILRKRFKKLNIIEENYSNVKLNEKYDYIVLIGNLDSIASNGETKKILEFAKNNLAESGKILLGFDNKFAIKFFAGDVKQSGDILYETIDKSVGVGYANITNLLNEMGLKFKMYYPFPDYKFTNVIYTDEMLPSAQSISSKVLSVSRMVLNFSEREALIQILKNDKNLFKYLANSYFIEISKQDINNDIRYVSYSFSRKKEYRLETIIENNVVTKKMSSKYSKKHYENLIKSVELLKEHDVKSITYVEDGLAKSEFKTNCVTLEDVVLDAIKEDNFEEIINNIDKYYNSILNKLDRIEYPENNIFSKYGIQDDRIKNMTYVKSGLLDAIFQNCFVIDNEIYWFDQEWIDENVPIEYILYRCIAYFKELKNYHRINEIYEKYNLSEYLDIFENLETKFQNSVNDETIWNLHFRTSRDTGIITENLSRQHEEILKFSALVMQRDNQIDLIHNSTSWKITKPLRFISDIIHKIKSKFKIRKKR